MAKIVSIKECTFGTDQWSTYEGFVVNLDDDQSIKLGISNLQSCCENWGYFMSQDDLSDFIGADLHDVKVVDTCLRVRSLPEYGLDSGEAVFVNIETSAGTLQFTAYNAHNGYYGHEAIVIRDGVKLVDQYL